MYMTTSGVFREVDCRAFKRYRDDLIAACGGPSDAIEVMLIEQLALVELVAGVAGVTAGWLTVADLVTLWMLILGFVGALGTVVGRLPGQPSAHAEFPRHARAGA